jgi:hypothetical protein
MKTNNRESIRTVFCIILTVSFLFFASCQDPSTPSITTPSTGSINGYAYYGNGDNHAGITVMLEQTDGLRSLSVISAARGIERGARSIAAPTVAASTRTAADGSYTFPSVSPGTYTIYAYSPDSQEKAVAINNVTVRAGESYIADALTLTPVGSVTGQITVDGEVSGNLGFLVCVAGTSYMAVTADDGTFTINDIPAGNGYFFTIIKGNFIAMWDTVPQTVNARETTTLSPNPRLINGDTINITGGIVWQGERTSHPDNPQLNWAYYNSTEKKSYIWDGSAWQVLAKDGVNGISFVWKGESATPPANPQLNWAYYNTFDKTSYIWDGTGWQVLTKDGADGISILWQGEHYSAPTGAQVNWAYYNITTGNAYIYDGTSWQIFMSSAGITWKGERTSHPEDPQLNWAYYNSEDGISYIWDGYEWQILAKDGGGALTGIEIQYLGTLLIGELPDVTKFRVRNVHEGGSKRDTSNYTYTVSGDIWTRGSSVTVTVTSIEDPAHSASVLIGVSDTLVDTGLPVIYIETENAAPIVSKEDWVNMTVKVVSDNPEYSFEKTSYNDQIRGRGNTSWNEPKKPYRIRFNEYTSMFGLTAARNWVLLADYKHAPIISAIGFELGQRFNGSLFPNHYVYVGVVLNGEYQGIYFLTEHMRVAPGRIEIDPVNDYLVEIDFSYDDYPRFRTPNLQLPVMIKSPEYGDDIQDSRYQFVVESINELDTALSDVNFPNNNWKDLIDIDTIIDYYMINEVIQNADFGIKNLLLYKVAGQKIKISHLWDIAWSFVTYLDPEFPSSYLHSSGELGNFGFTRFFYDQAYVEKYKKRWNEKMAIILSMTEFIDQKHDELKAAYSIEYRRWYYSTTDGHGIIPPDNYDHYKQQLITWYNNRVQWLNLDINNR